LRKQKFGMLCSLPGLIVILIIIFFPLAYNVCISFTRYNLITPIAFNGLDNYTYLFTSFDFYNSWFISFLYSMGTTILALLVGILLAHSLSSIKKFSTLFRTIAILPWAAPVVISGLMWKWLLSKDLGIVNYIFRALGITQNNIGFLVESNPALLSGVVAAAWAYIPFMTVMLLAGLETISPELYEAAEIDGADSLQQFWHISIPLNKGQIMIASLTVWMFTFRTPDLFVSLTTGGPGKSTYHIGILLQDLIYRYMNFGRGAALGIILFITTSIPALIILSRSASDK
jgi:multiple sugar transport system permease protein